MKLLLAVDGSKPALEAVKFVIRHLDWASAPAEIELLTVHRPVPRLPGLSRVVGRAALRRYYDEEGAERLAAARRLLDRAGVAYRARVLVGAVAETLVAHARGSGCDLIVIGNRGMNAAASLLLGSVASKVLQLAAIPVLLVK
jgi:nucleotide-binding universal stress UspA family protein